MNAQPRRLFVTGGASGLGRAVALRFAAAGARVCVGDVHDARGEETREALARAGAADRVFLHCDVTREEDLRAAAEHLEARWGGVDVVVNNAGVASGGAIEDIPIDDWRWILEVNLLGVVRGCRVFTPMFKRQRHGHFVNVASMAGLLDVPMMSSYNASKAAVVSLSETLQHELADDGIAVTVVCPSFFKTNLSESFRTTSPGLRVAMEKLLARSRITAEQIADDIYRAVARRDFYVLPHPEARTTWMFKRLVPRPLYAALMRRQTRRLRAARGAASAAGVTKASSASPLPNVVAPAARGGSGAPVLDAGRATDAAAAAAREQNGGLP